MNATGWSWEEMQNTPHDVARDMAWFLSIKGIVEAGKGELELPLDDEDSESDQTGS